jgi:hypothetical protein
MAISWTTMFAFEPPLVAGADSNPRSSLAAMRAMRDRRIAIMALKKAPQVVGIGKSAGLDADTQEIPPGSGAGRARGAAGSGWIVRQS